MGRQADLLADLQAACQAADHELQAVHPAVAHEVSLSQAACQAADHGQVAHRAERQAAAHEAARPLAPTLTAAVREEDHP